MMDWGRQFDRVLPALIAGVVVFGLQQWKDGNAKISDRVAKAVTKTYIDETYGRRITANRSLSNHNDRVNQTQNRRWARACDRLDMACDFSGGMRYNSSMSTDEVPQRLPARRSMYTTTACEINVPVMPVPYRHTEPMIPDPMPRPADRPRFASKGKEDVGFVWARR